MFFTKPNTRIFIALLLCLITGFILMISDNQTGQEASADIFSFRTITLAPILILASYAGFFIFILKKRS